MDSFIYPVDFVVLDTCPLSSIVKASQTPIILGHPFLATSNAVIHCTNVLLKLTFGHITLEMNIFNVGNQLGDDDDVAEVSMIESCVQEHVDNILGKDPLEVCLTTAEMSILESSEEMSFFKLLNGDLEEICGIDGMSKSSDRL